MSNSELRIKALDLYPDIKVILITGLSNPKITPSYNQARQRGIAPDVNKHSEGRIVIFIGGVLQYPPPGLPGQFLGAWCKGSTEVFGTFDPGSNPGAPA